MCRTYKALRKRYCGYLRGNFRSAEGVYRIVELDTRGKARVGYMPTRADGTVRKTSGNRGLVQKPKKLVTKVPATTYLPRHSAKYFRR
jgi:hypothetical protein